MISSSKLQPRNLMIRTPFPFFSLQYYGGLNDAKAVTALINSRREGTNQRVADLKLCYESRATLVLVPQNLAKRACAGCRVEFACADEWGGAGFARTLVEREAR